MYHGKWSYDIGVVLKGYQLAYQQTKDIKYLNYIKETMDYYIQEDGSIKNYDIHSKNIDNINNGKLLFLLYKETKLEKYKIALDTLYHQVENMPRIKEGGFWHKKIYPNQMWLDGLYMGSPFYAEYLVTFKNGEGLDDVIKQFTLCYKRTLDEKTGLLYHAYDAEKIQPWADKETGHSPHFWGRAMGWYMMALVDTIEILKNYPEYAKKLIEIYLKVLTAIKKVQDEKTLVWYQVLDSGSRRGNYLEASCSSMFCYAFAKGLELEIISQDEKSWILNTYDGLLKEFVFETKEGWINLIHNCQVAGLGGSDKRDGSFVYYISEPIITNDFKGYGAFLQAALTVENL